MHPESDWRRLVEAVTSLVRRRAGLTHAAGRDVGGAMSRVMTAGQRADPGAYLRLLDRDTEAFDALIGELTVGETYFLRETEQLDFLRREVLPGLAGRQFGAIHAWSAGCASGEEAYTLAMLFHDAGVGERTRVLGTDIARDRLRQARQGRYRTWSFRGVPDAVQRRYFRPNRGTFEVLPELRASVEFRFLNLLDDDYRHAGVHPGGMDLILCRNVLIYLDAECVAHVARRLFDSLSPDGWLLLAASDPRLNDLVDCDALVTGSGVIYRKAAPTPAFRVAPPPIDAPAPALQAPARTERLRPPAATPGPAAPRPSSAAAAEEALETRDMPETLAARVRFLADRGDLARAGMECAAARERHPGSAELAYLEALLLLEGRNYAAAMSAARRALYLNPRLVVAHLALGSACARLGRTDAALRALANAERLLAAQAPEAVVPASGGATASAVTELARIQLRQLQEMAS